MIPGWDCHVGQIAANGLTRPYHFDEIQVYRRFVQPTIPMNLGFAGMYLKPPS
jgi:hypothetical protein